MEAARPRPPAFLNWLYGGKPWSRPRCMFIADKSPTMQSIVGQGVRRFSRTAGEKNLGKEMRLEQTSGKQIKPDCLS